MCLSKISVKKGLSFNESGTTEIFPSASYVVIAILNTCVSKQMHAYLLCKFCEKNILQLVSDAIFLELNFLELDCINGNNISFWEHQQKHNDECIQCVRQIRNLQSGIPVLQDNDIHNSFHHFAWPEVRRNFRIKWKCTLIIDWLIDWCCFKSLWAALALYRDYPATLYWNGPFQLKP